jgi:deoxyribonuclease IV
MTDELGAHVSTAGGVARAPERAAQLDAGVLQLFTKQPSRWAEPTLSDEIVREFQRERARFGIRAVASHDAYLINLATPDTTLFERSCDAFCAELKRCTTLGIEYIVTHPGNATDRETDRGLQQNSDAIQRALELVPGATMVLLETTPGGGSALGATFEQLAAIRDRIAAPHRDRVGFCVDTCHIWVAGYDLRDDYDGVMSRLDEMMGIEHVRFFHLNDSVGDRGSRRDRHAHIGEGTLGEAPFRRLMNDERFAAVPKVLETPKGEDPKRYAEVDRMNLGRLRAMRAAR